MELINKIRDLIVKVCRLKVSPQGISEDMLLFDKEGLNLDSVDALQIIVAMAKEFNVEVPENDMASLLTIKKIAEFVESRLANATTNA